MTCHNPPSLLRLVALLIAGGACGPALCAQGPQGPIPDAPRPSEELAVPIVMPAPAAAVEHKFWDKQNIELFAASAAWSAADFTVTSANLQSGGRELNPIVRLFGRSKVGLALNFAGEAAGGVSLSYFFHKTHHHKLERMVSLVNISGSVGGVSYGLAHRQRLFRVSFTQKNPGRSTWSGL